MSVPVLQGMALCLAATVAWSGAVWAGESEATDPRGERPQPPASASILPPYAFDRAREPELMATAGLPVADVRFRGHSVIAEQRLQALAAPYTGRTLALAELADLQDAVTGLYVEQGYLTSGAVVKGLDAGVLDVDVVEGRLAEVVVQTDGRLSPEYLARYLEGFGPLDPVNVFDVERRLQTLQQESHVSRLEARLLPGARVGESVLEVRAFETAPWAVRLELSNHQSPAIGEWNGRLALTARNLSGRTDDLALVARLSEGMDELSVDYDTPLNAVGTRLSLFASASDSEIVAAPFDDLGIEAETRTFGARLSQPLRRSPSGHSRLSLSMEWRESETFLLGSGFSFVEGPEEGLSQVAALRVAWEELHRGATNVLAARVALSFGLDAFGATEAAGGVADGTFRKLVAQLQWARRLALRSSQLVLRVDAQLTEDPLLGMEQIPLGGRWAVRGYRENTLIRDNAVIGSLEWRLPLWRDPRGASIVELRPFVDGSWSSNENRDEIGPQGLYSVGLGVVWQPAPSFQAELYWGEALNDLDYPVEYSVQDDGLHARLSWTPW